MNDERQSQLLAAYLEALQGDSHAAPPPALDPALASMARRLFMARSAPPSAAARDRVWQRALASAQTSRASVNGHGPHKTDKEILMTAIPRALPKRRAAFSFAPIAATIALVATVAVLLIVRPPSGPADDQPGMLSQPEQGSEPTSTPLPTIVPTSTPFPANASVGGEPTPTMALIEHRVQAGETLDQILLRYGVTDPAAVNQVIMMNPAARDGALAAGDVILIPLTLPTVVPPMGMATATPVPFNSDPSLANEMEIIAYASQTAAAVLGLPGTSTPFPATLVPPMGDPSGLSPSAGVHLPPTVVPPGWMQAERQPIEVGETVTGELSPSAPGVAYSFIAEQTGPVFARVRSENLTRLGIGFQVTRAGSGGGGGGGGGGDRATTNEITGSQFVYAGDEVTVLVNNAGNEEGSFTLSVQQATAVALSYGETVEGTINENQPIAYFTFNGQQGDVVTIRATGVDGYDTVLTLLSGTPQQTLVYDDDGGPAYDPEIIDYALPMSGEFAILVEPGALSGGRFSLTLEHEAALSLDDGPQQVNFNNKSRPPLVFEGEAGTTVQLNLTAVSGSAAARFIGMRVFQNGALIADISRDFGQLSAGAQSASGALLSSSTVAIPADGLVLVEVIASTTLADDESLSVEVELVPVE